MKTEYYVNVNRQPSGEHEVHQFECRYLPKPENRLLVGRFDNCHAAVAEAGKLVSPVDGCRVCCPDCHTR